MKIKSHDIAVCSWSLRPASTADLIRQVHGLGLSHVQLALAPLLALDESGRSQAIADLRGSRLLLTGGMIAFPGEDYSTIDAIRRTGGLAPDADWPARSQLARSAAQLGAELGIRSITTHVGFVPAFSDASYGEMRRRVGVVAESFASFGIDLLMETGQERADELLEFLHDLRAPNVRINFDPANMILYGAGDPIDAIAALGSSIRHVHVKDAIASASPGQTWGEEVAFGAGQVGAARFLSALEGAHYAGPLAIEREAGATRQADVAAAIAALQAAAR